MLNALPLQEVIKKVSVKNKVKDLFEGFLSPPSVVKQKPDQVNFVEVQVY